MIHSQHIALLIFVFISCGKQNSNTPENYVGTWIAETPEILQTKNRIHALYLPSEGKGTYTSVGAYKLNDQDNKDYVQVTSNTLTVGSKEFEIIKAPYSDSTDVGLITKMELVS